eukprot:scaffold97323_cov21-Tisochrysis_lutea.AAC.1
MPEKLSVPEGMQELASVKTHTHTHTQASKQASKHTQAHKHTYTRFPTCSLWLIAAQPQMQEGSQAQEHEHAHSEVSQSTRFTHPLIPLHIRKSASLQVQAVLSSLLHMQNQTVMSSFPMCRLFLCACNHMYLMASQAYKFAATSIQCAQPCAQ